MTQVIFMLISVLIVIFSSRFCNGKLLFCTSSKYKWGACKSYKI